MLIHLKRRSSHSYRAVIGSVLSLVLLAACGTTDPTGVAGQRTATLTRGPLLASVSANGNIQAEEETRLSFAAIGRTTAVQVKMGDVVQRDDLLAELDTTEATLALRRSAAALRDAEAAVIIAQANYSRTLDGLRPADVAAASASVRAAQASYNKVAAGPSDEDIRAAKARLGNVEAALKMAQANYDNANRQNPASISASPEALALEQATNNYNAAKAEYDKTTQPATEADKANAQSQIAAARAQLSQASRAVRNYDVDSAKAEIAQAQNRVVQAMLDMDSAQHKIDQAKILAPFDGIVASVDVKVGEQVGGNGQTVITLIDTSQMHININVDEIDVAKVKIGQAVSVKLDSLPGVDLRGNVERISPISKMVNGVVTYGVRVALPQAQDQLRPGMTANARIVLDQRNGVVLAPIWAIRKDKTSGKSFITVPNGTPADNRVTEVEVVVGLKDDVMAEIISGADEGAVVVQPSLDVVAP